MACASCGKKTSRAVAVTKTIVGETGYVYADDGEIVVVYTGLSVQRYVGKCSRKIYLFGVGAVRPVDACDAVEFLKLKWFELPKVEEVVEDVQTDSGISEENSE